MCLYRFELGLDEFRHDLDKFGQDLDKFEQGLSLEESEQVLNGWWTENCRNMKRPK